MNRTQKPIQNLSKNFSLGTLSLGANRNGQDSSAGVKMGLSRQVANELTVQTVLGSALLVRETGISPGELKNRVTSPGGTTIAGLHALEKGSLRATLMNAVEKATLRSKELAS
tara:strand:+ start:154 stop:492 length:339 start_codon:yes stop_codon:yes gene_type:complete